MKWRCKIYGDLKRIVPPKREANFRFASKSWCTKSQNWYAKKALAPTGSMKRTPLKPLETLVKSIWVGREKSVIHMHSKTAPFYLPWVKAHRSSLPSFNHGCISTDNCNCTPQVYPVFVKFKLVCKPIWWTILYIYISCRYPFWIQ